MHEFRNKVERFAWIFFRDCFPGEFFLYKMPGQNLIFATCDA